MTLFSRLTPATPISQGSGVSDQPATMEAGLPRVADVPQQSSTHVAACRQRAADQALAAHTLARDEAGSLWPAESLRATLGVCGRVAARVSLTGT